MRILNLSLHPPERGLARAFIKRGHTVVHRTADDFSPVDRHGVDCILFIPPCHTFSVASLGHHWGPDYTPKTEDAKQGIITVARGLDFIEEADPSWWIMENPRNMLRKLPVVVGLDRVTVTLCQYGDTRMKPTDLWGGFPEGWESRPMCSPCAPCHERAPRGSRRGTQGRRSAAERFEIPHDLSLSLCLDMEDQC